MKKLVFILLLLAVIMLIVPTVSAEYMPDKLTVPTEVRTENILDEEYQYRTLIYYTLGDDIINIMSTVPSDYGALTMEGKLYLQFSIDGGNWISFYFTAQDEEGKEIQTTGKKLPVSKKGDVSVLNLMREQDRAQLPEEVYSYDADSPENSYLLTDTHDFRFRVRAELEWIDKEELKPMNVSSPWSKPATVKTVVSEETLPGSLHKPSVVSVLPGDGASGAEITVTVKAPRQVSLIEDFLKKSGGGIALEEQISKDEGEWLDTPAVSSDILNAVFKVPESLGLETAADVRISDIRVRFRYAAEGRGLNSEWTEPSAVGEYIEQSENPEFAKPSFLANKFLGIKVWIWILGGAVLLLALTVWLLVRGRKR